MSKIADLYIRVSTDEQADKGYSQRNQEEVLKKYCHINGIQVRQVVFEDHSAKSFNRPAWKNLLLSLKKKRHGSDLVLFTKWDRFSRNAGDAYQMINVLRKVGVEPQAIEQPLDLSIPENKMMLAFYLAAPEVENDRRAMNIFFGMRRAMKEGRYMGLAPIGYTNKTDERGRKYIAPKEPQATIIRWAFEELAKGGTNTETIFKLAKEKGLTSTKAISGLPSAIQSIAEKYSSRNIRTKKHGLQRPNTNPLYQKRCFTKYKTPWMAEAGNIK